MMRSSPSQLQSAPQPAPGRQGWAARTPADYTSLLLELARAQRGFVYYPETDARRRALADRAHRAIASELARGGPIDLACATDGGDPRFSALPAGAAEPIAIDATGPLRDLASTWTRHGVARIQLDAALTVTALGALLDALGRPVEGSPDVPGLVRRLSSRDARGLRLNDLDAAEPAARPALSSTPLRARASISPHATPASDAEKPDLADAPLEAAAHDETGERLRARLIELDATIDDDAYHARLLDIAAWSEELWRGGHRDDCFRAMLVVADHAIGAGGRSERQARAAAETFDDLALGDPLDDLIHRATAPDSIGIRAAQLLLHLGEKAVPAILSRLALESDEGRAGPLRALILTQGETALAALLDAIRSQDPARVRLGIRLAGELQNPLVLPALLNVLRSPERPPRLEAIRSLGVIPGEESLAALRGALSADDDEVAACAAHALAGRIGAEVVAPILDLLESSVQDGRTPLACGLVQALGRVGDERAVPRLCALLDRKPLLRRAHWHSIQLVAIDALASLPTREARRCIERASRHATQSIRARALEVLDDLAAVQTR